MINTTQVIEELWWHDGHFNEDQRDYLIQLLEKFKPQYCIETGFATGRSTVTTLLAAQPKFLVSIDVDLDYMGARSHAKSLLEKFRNLTIIEGDSSNIMTADFFNCHFPNGIDFAFIDGSHTYSGALSDIEKVFQQMNIGGIMIIDDYLSGAPNGCSIPDVDAAVNDFSISREIAVDRWSCKGKGFAILRKS